jgi:pimeloyl-ACP methyl ester carboxylesterase
MFGHAAGNRGLATVALLALLAAGCSSALPTSATRPIAATASAPPIALTSPTSSPVTTTPSASATRPVGPFRPHFDGTPCPDDVTANVVLQVSCGYLTVLEDRSKPDGRTIQLFVARFDPPGGTTTPDPVILIGDLAAQPDYGGQAGAGQRTHRIEYLLDPRGIGHSKPSLDCPEVAAGGLVLAGLTIRDPTRKAALVATIRACHDRLVGQGIDLAAYDLAANVQDLEDLRTTLGIAQWNIGAEGDASVLALEEARQFPTGVRSLFIDSLTLPTPDFLTIGPTSLDLAISRLVAACNAQSACTTSTPHLDSMIRSAEAILEAKPITLEVAHTVEAVQAGHPIKVVIDGAALVRWIRWSLSDSGGQGASAVPGTVRAILSGTLTGDDPIAVSLASDVGDCLGVLPHCDERLNFGALYSLVCGSVASGIDEAALQAAIQGRAAYADVFAPSPLLAACGVWPVGHSDRGLAGPVTGGLPTLVLHGGFDPFSSPPSGIAGLPDVFLLEIPNQSYNALGFSDCPLAIRNAWIDAPTARPPDTSCLGQIPEVPLAP